ncbi:MAG: sigma 54-interacting transcriptional regulator [Planctomycetota bacterium]|jgi:DNA-binding NtrC family response regulator
MLLRVLLAMRDAPLRRRLREMLPASDVIVEAVRSGSHLWERAARRTADVVIAARSAIPDPMEDSIALFQGLPDSPAIVVLTENETPEERAQLLAAGCDMVLHPSLPEESISDALFAVLEKRSSLSQESLVVRAPLAQPQLSDFVSESATMQTFMQVVRRVVQSDTSLLILGETGVGKERLARAIHAEGRRSEGPFIAVNCGALPESLLESELFGHEEGAFTGATRSRRGAFELAHAGIIFLDEIGEMAVHLQVKLLQALQDHEIRRVGSEGSFAVDVRVMAASNRNLEEEARAGRFRKDLFYRLSVVTLTVPPLRERGEDIPSLVGSYIDYLRPRVGRDVYGITDDAMEALCQYSWPGNVRELINVVERGMLLCGGDQIMPGDLPASISGLAPSTVQGERWPWRPPNAEDMPQDWLDTPLREVRQSLVEGLERAYLAAQLERTGGRVGQTAEKAGLQPRSVYEKMKRYGLRKEDFRRRQRRP